MSSWSSTVANKLNTNLIPFSSVSSASATPCCAAAQGKDLLVNCPPQESPRAGCMSPAAMTHVYVCVCVPVDEKKSYFFASHFRCLLAVTSLLSLAHSNQEPRLRLPIPLKDTDTTRVPRNPNVHVVRSAGLSAGGDGLGQNFFFDGYLKFFPTPLGVGFYFEIILPFVLYWCSRFFCSFPGGRDKASLTASVPGLHKTLISEGSSS